MFQGGKEKWILKTHYSMPKTEFEMRGKLPSKEPKFQERWESMHLYEKMLEKRAGAEDFVLHDDSVDGAMHIGHALNKTLKDIINRSKFMEGYRVDFVHGLGYSRLAD